MPDSRRQSIIKIRRGITHRKTVLVNSVLENVEAGKLILFSTREEREKQRLRLQLVFDPQNPELQTGEDTPAPLSPSPPSGFWLTLLLPADKQDDFLANMEELYLEKWLPRFGKHKADWIWRTQGFRLVFSKALTYVLDIFDRIKSLKIG